MRLCGTNPGLVTILGKPHYLLHIPTMVIEFKFLNSNPESGDSMVGPHRSTQRFFRRLLDVQVTKSLHKETKHNTFMNRPQRHGHRFVVGTDKDVFFCLVLNPTP